MKADIDSQSIKFFDPRHPLAHIGQKIGIAFLILAVVVGYYITRYAKGLEFLATLAKGAPLLLLGMLIAENAYLVFQGGLMQGIYRAVGFKRRLRYTTSLYVGMNLVNTLAPVAGISGSLYMMHFERKRGLKDGDTFLINFLYYLTDYIVFLIVLLLGLLYLLVIGEITRTILLTSIIFTAFVLGLLIIALFLFGHPTALHRVIHWINRFFSKLFLRKKQLFKDRVIERFAEGVREAWRRSRHSYEAFFNAAISAFFLHISCLILLGLAFSAFQIPVTFQIMVAGYTVGTLLNIVSFTPAGIGFAEGGMTAVFASLGIPVEQALVVSLVYRLFFVFYPLLLGLIALRALPSLAKATRSDESLI